MLLGAAAVNVLLAADARDPDGWNRVTHLASTNTPTRCSPNWASTPTGSPTSAPAAWWADAADDAVA